MRRFRQEHSPAVDAPVRTGSLSRRVVVCVLVLMLAALTALALIVNSVLAGRLHSDLRSRLVDRAYHAQALVQDGVTGQTLADEVAGGGIDTLYRTTTGRTYVGAQAPVPPNWQAGRPPGGPFAGRYPGSRPVNAATPSVSQSGDILTTTVSVSGGELILQTSQRDVDHALSELRTVELFAGGGVLLVTALVLLLCVRLALLPLSRMTDLARGIAGGARGRRLRPTRPGTELGRTAAAFDDMLDALESAERQAQAAEARMRAFLADASHDLRTPLAGVIASAETVLRTDPDRAEREERLVGLVREARRASRLVDDLLLAARLDGPAQPGVPVRRRVPLDLSLLCGQAAGTLRLRRPDLDVSFDSSPGPVVGDPDQLTRLLGNLLDNAAAATGPGGRVRIGLTCSDGVRLEVRDDGAGVPSAERERIFERFVRLDPARTGGGSGLGLPIARAIARAHGGDLTCEPAPAGACFVLTLPVAAVPTEPPVLATRGTA